MSFFRLYFLRFFVMIAGMYCFCIADVEAARLGDVGKCGRDCIYYVSHRFGQQISLEEIDRQLSYQTNISFADMRKTFEQKGFFCQSMMFNSQNIGRLQNTLGAHTDSLFAIAALPTSSATEHHFVIITKCTGSTIHLFDVSTNRIATVNTADYQGNSIAVPVLLVSKEPVRYTTFSNTEFLIGIAICVFVLSMRYGIVVKKWGHCFWQGMNITIGYCVHVLTFRRLSITGGIVIVFIILAFVYQEYQYHKHPLELIKPQIDLGELELFSKNSIDIDLRNNSRRPISIKGVQVSCSCLTIENYPKVIEPKGIETIKLSLTPLLEGDVLYQTLIVPEDVTPIISKISYSGFQHVRLLPKYRNVGLVEQGEQQTFACEYKVEDLRDNLLFIESAKMHGDEPIFTIIGDLPKTLQNGEAFTFSVKYIGNAPIGTFLQSFEIKGKGESGKEIVLLSNIIGLVIE